MKINFDTTIRFGFSMVAIIGRNDVGDILFAQSFVLPPMDPLIGETKAILLALELELHHQHIFVLFEEYSFQVI